MNFISRLKRRFKSIIETLKSNDGITLIEIMIVITIIGILSILIVPRFMDLPQKARVQAAKQQMSSFGLALDRFYLDNGFYPTSDQGLEALITMPSSEPAPNNFNDGGYMKRKEIPKDPWGRSYIYVSPGEQGNDYEIISYGVDGMEGGEGVNADIKSW